MQPSCAACICFDSKDVRFHQTCMHADIRATASAASQLALRAAAARLRGACRGQPRPLPHARCRTAQPCHANARATSAAFGECSRFRQACWTRAQLAGKRAHGVARCWRIVVLRIFPCAPACGRAGRQHVCAAGAGGWEGRSVERGRAGKAPHGQLAAARRHENHAHTASGALRHSSSGFRWRDSGEWVPRAADSKRCHDAWSACGVGLKLVCVMTNTRKFE